MIHNVCVCPKAQITTLWLEDTLNVSCMNILDPIMFPQNFHFTIPLTWIFYYLSLSERPESLQRLTPSSSCKYTLVLNFTILIFRPFSY